jgi:uncharacterized protein (DUF4415 family)
MSDPRRKRTKAQERELKLMIDELQRERRFFDSYSKARPLVPEGWELLEHEAPVRPRKTKVTIRLDADMVRWYRHIGFGYQGRMNAVLRAYMHATLAKYIERPGDRDAMGRPI